MPNGVHSATTDEKTIKSWFATYPNANYGISTAALPTVDIDPRNGGDKSWSELVKANYDVVGWRVRTGGGGTHIMFGTVPTLLPNCDLAKGIEFQSVGKYIVGVGSLHKSGKRYTWDISAMPARDQTSPEGPPPWLVKLITESKAKPAARRSPQEQSAFLDALLAPAENGDRHKKYSRDIGHLISARNLDRRMLVCLYDSHVARTWDCVGFDEDERTTIAQDLINKDNAKSEGGLT